MTVKTNATGGSYIHGKAFSADKRECILFHYQSSLRPSCRGTAEALGVSPSVVSKIVRQHRAMGHVRPLVAQPPFRRLLDANDDQFIAEQVADDPRLYLDELQVAVALHRNKVVSLSTIRRSCARMGLTRKKVSAIAKQRFRESTVARTREFTRAMRIRGVFRAPNVVFLDETAVNNRVCYRRYGRAKRGQPAVVVENHPKQKRISVLAAISTGGRSPLVAYTMREGSYNRQLFMEFLEQDLLPRMRDCRQTVLVMDNCSIHKGDAVRQLCTWYGVDVEFLPPYTPTLNPIELMFSKFKAVLRREFHRVDICTFAAICTALGHVTAADVRNWVHHCGYRM